MGRRSRKRSTAPVPPPPRAEAVHAAPTAPAPRAPTWRARMNEAPKAAWSPFPLTELCILLSIVLIVLGFFTTGDRRGVLLGGGFLLVTLAAGELALREHFAGFRSHTVLLSSMCAILAAIPVWALPVPQELVVLVAVLAFAAAVVPLRRAFIRRSGGVGFRA
jgi:hypothetical protein